jgi:WD40 repeat protein
LDVIWFQNFSNAVTTAKFSKNGRWLGVGQANTDTIRIYNVPSFTLNNSFRANHQNSSNTIWELDFNPNDTKIVTCASDGYVNQITISTQITDWKRVLTNNKDSFTC